jgi:hypothetical protein
MQPWRIRNPKRGGEFRVGLCGIELNGSRHMATSTITPKDGSHSTDFIDPSREVTV